MDGACSTYGGLERCIRGFGGETRGKEIIWEERILLKWIFRK
jgi:hypothetical protein